MTRFKALFELADGVKERLKDLGIFKAVSVAAVSSGGQIWISKDVFNVLPAAIVCIGSADFDSHGLVRNGSVLIILADNFKKDTEAKAGGIWPLIDSVCASFMPQVTPGQLPVMPVIEGVEFELKSFSPIESQGSLVTFERTNNAG